MKKLFDRLLILLVFCLIASAQVTACAPKHGANAPGVDANPDRGIVLAYTGAVVAWAVLDELERVRLKAINDKGDPQLAAAELPKAEKRNATLHRIRDVLAVVRGYVAGEKKLADARGALRDGAELLGSVVDQLRAEGVKIPEEVDKGIAVASGF